MPPTLIHIRETKKFRQMNSRDGTNCSKKQRDIFRKKEKNNCLLAKTVCVGPSGNTELDDQDRHSLKVVKLTIKSKITIRQIC
jgi:hypothetical protein